MNTACPLHSLSCSLKDFLHYRTCKSVKLCIVFMYVPFATIRIRIEAPSRVIYAKAIFASRVHANNVGFLWLFTQFHILVGVYVCKNLFVYSFHTCSLTYLINSYFRIPCSLCRFVAHHLADLLSCLQARCKCWDGRQSSCVGIHPFAFFQCTVSNLV